MRHERVNFGRRRLLAEQIVVVAVLGCGMKVDAMRHVPQWFHTGHPKNVLSCIIARIRGNVYKVLGINSAILLHLH